MRPGIFTRMMIGYLAILIPLAAVSAYTFSRFSAFRAATDEILHADQRLKDLVQAVGESIISQTGFDRKYIITGDREYFFQFERMESEISSMLAEAMTTVRNDEKKEMVERIYDAYGAYKDVFYEEASYVENKDEYLPDAFRVKKEVLTDGVLLELRNLRMMTERETFEKVEILGDSVSEATKMVAVIVAGCVVLGIIISVLVTRSITIPLSIMRRKTRRIARGDFDGGLEISAPPEICDLARDFNSMCDKLQETDKIKSDFFSLMAHELRTPLASIREGTNLLLNNRGEDFRENQTRVLRIITEESNRLTDLVNSLLDLSKMEAGMLSLKREKFDIGSLILKAVSGMEPLAMTKNIGISWQVPQALPQVSADEERLLQALRNLIGNAVKFTPEGGRIVITARPCDGGVEVSVADSGHGIPPEDLEVIFDKFRQSAMTNFSTIKGTGLGLAIVKHIITAHGGRIWATSEAGRGSIFTFQLPS
jgi:two-component system sensor histidine kinase GlrK